jgi:hypothetical protein
MIARTTKTGTKPGNNPFTILTNSEMFFFMVGLSALRKISCQHIGLSISSKELRLLIDILIAKKLTCNSTL